MTQSLRVPMAVHHIITCSLYVFFQYYISSELAFLVKLHKNTTNTKLHVLWKQFQSEHDKVTKEKAPLLFNHQVVQVIGVYASP